MKKFTRGVCIMSSGKPSRHLFIGLAHKFRLHIASLAGNVSVVGIIFTFEATGENQGL
jgi:hypothetical protein